MKKDKFTSADRYTHSVVDVAVRLAGAASGSADSLSEEDEANLAEWLQWRTCTNNWTSGTRAMAEYDRAVLDLARAALRFAAGERESIKAHGARRNRARGR